MKKIFILCFLLICSRAFADFNTGDTFGKGIVVQANGVTQTGGGRTLNFSSGTTVTNNGNVYNITSSGTGPGSLWTESGANTYSKAEDTVTVGTSSTSLDTFTVQTASGGETINYTVTNSATGGTTTTSGGNEIHTFTSSGTFTPNFTGTVSVLVVGGGASGGTFGGGAAGGYRTNSSYAVTANSGITVTIGAGGVGVATSKGNSGGDSIFGTITSTGGGAGGGGSTAGAPATGGSGGGGGQNDDNSNQTGAAGNTPSTSPSQGNSGGTANHSGGSQAAGGGGGGAGAVGANASGATTAGNGGSGTANSISGGSVTYACGGGGGAYNFGGTGTKGSGGCASAGNGGVNGTTSTSASANSGSGGGGQGLDSTGNGQGATSGAGGSGIVIVSFSASATPSLRLDSAGTQTAKLWTNGASNNDVNLDVGTTTRLSLNGTTGAPTFSALSTAGYTKNSAAGALSSQAVPIPVGDGGTNATSASITAFNNITGYSASGATGTTSTNLVFSTSPTLITPTLGAASATSILNGDGSAPTPAYSFTSTPNMGFIRSSATAMGVAVGGIEGLRFDTSNGIFFRSDYFLAWSSTTGYGARDLVMFRSGTRQLTINDGASGSVNVVLNGTFSKYNSISTVSNGIASELATIDTTGLTANVTAATLYTVPSTGVGMYRVSAYAVETTAGSISSTLPNIQLVYTDNDSNTSVTIDATPVLGVAGIGQTGALTANTVGTASSGVIVIYAKASTTIQYQTVNYASNLAGMTYAIHIKLEAL